MSKARRKLESQYKIDVTYCYISCFAQAYLNNFLYDPFLDTEMFEIIYFISETEIPSNVNDDDSVQKNEHLFENIYSKMFIINVKYLRVGSS